MNIEEVSIKFIILSLLDTDFQIEINQLDLKDLEGALENREEYTKPVWICNLFNMM